jgi:hypothetical protein
MVAELGGEATTMRMPRRASAWFIAAAMSAAAATR